VHHGRAAMLGRRDAIACLKNESAQCRHVCSLH
jgi:hypothetical protein